MTNTSADSPSTSEAEACVEFAHFTVDASRDGEVRQNTARFFDLARQHLDGMQAFSRVHMGPGTWVDIVHWRSRAAATTAMEQFAKIPELCAMTEGLLKDVEIKHGQVVHRGDNTTTA